MFVWKSPLSNHHKSLGRGEILAIGVRQAGVASYILGYFLQIKSLRKREIGYLYKFRAHLLLTCSTFCTIIEWPWINSWLPNFYISTGNTYRNTRKGLSMVFPGKNCLALQSKFSFSSECSDLSCVVNLISFIAMVLYFSVIILIRVVCSLLECGLYHS